MNDFVATIFELFYYSAPFSDDVYAEGIYGQLALVNLLSSFLVAILFYYIINRPSFSRWYHWLLMLIINFLVTYSFAYTLTYNRFTALELEYSSEYFMFSLFNALIASTLFVIFSFSIRWWSSSAKRTPIPH
ncbi:hypothetical protein COR50_04130 [Chitinophaga caeni]|uniref:Uncharacterized protein n=1 Tax=Chitinophaga caeni TaxID=2029983 RepID=A0A291QR66_9BACT|nr:hypothetical protein [Chitinophaga caeni]ATL46426.1 hypothetical protein COR50_04130 [Chitinophaga caeni]